MSHEGYSQFFCKNGHYWTVNCEELPNLRYEEPKKQKCPICKEEEVFENIVNVTNGSWDEEGKRIDGYIKPKSIKKHKMQCPNCHRHKICECSTYEVPKKKGDKI